MSFGSGQDKARIYYLKPRPCLLMDISDILNKHFVMSVAYKAIVLVVVHVSVIAVV